MNTGTRKFTAKKELHELCSKLLVDPKVGFGKTNLPVVVIDGKVTVVDADILRCKHQSIDVAHEFLKNVVEKLSKRSCFEYEFFRKPLARKLGMRLVILDILFSEAKQLREINLRIKNVKPLFPLPENAPCIVTKLVDNTSPNNQHLNDGVSGEIEYLAKLCSIVDAIIEGEIELKKIDYLMIQ
jgi:hypothetical protein